MIRTDKITATKTIAKVSLEPSSSVIIEFSPNFPELEVFPDTDVPVVIFGEVVVDELVLLTK